MTITIFLHVCCVPQLPTLPQSVTEREYHSVSVLHLGPSCVWVIVFGGIADPERADTAIIELSEHRHQ